MDANGVTSALDDSDRLTLSFRRHYLPSDHAGTGRTRVQHPAVGCASAETGTIKAYGEGASIRIYTLTSCIFFDKGIALLFVVQ
jgi:hypothetical protein